MADCLVFQFSAPNGIGLNPQTVQAIYDCVSSDRTEVWFQLQSLKASLETTACGRMQLDGVDENEAGDTNPDFSNTWATLQVGEVVTDDFRVNLTGTFTNDEVIGTNCSNTTVPVPTPTPTPSGDEQAPADDAGLTVASVNVEAPLQTPAQPSTAPEPVAPALVPLPLVQAPTAAQSPLVPLPVVPAVALIGQTASRGSLAATGSSLDLTSTMASGAGLGVLGLALIGASLWKKVHNR